MAILANARCVRVAAFLALQNCTCMSDGDPALPSGQEYLQPRPEMPETVLQPQPDPAADGESNRQYASYYDRIEQTRSFAELVSRAQQTLATADPDIKNRKEPPRRPVQSLLTIWQRTSDNPSTSESELSEAPQFAAQQPTLAPQSSNNTTPWPQASESTPAFAPMQTSTPGYARLPDTLAVPTSQPGPAVAQAYPKPAYGSPQPKDQPTPRRSSFPPAFTNPNVAPMETARPAGETIYR